MSLSREGAKERRRAPTKGPKESISSYEKKEREREGVREQGSGIDSKIKRERPVFLLRQKAGRTRKETTPYYLR